MYDAEVIRCEKCDQYAHHISYEEIRVEDNWLYFDRYLVCSLCETTRILEKSRKFRGSPEACLLVMRRENL